MTERTQLLNEFLSNSTWKTAQRITLAGDASLRRYERLVDIASGQSAIVMDAPPEKGEDVKPFLNVAAYLRTNGLSAPEIYDADEVNGFLILEDFGHDLFDVICDTNPEKETEIYALAVDTLAHLAAAPPLANAVDFQPKMLDLALTSLKWYAEPATGHTLIDAQAECAAALSPLIDTLGAGRITILRDFHAQNLLWLPNRPTPKNVGLLDFQDAVIGHPAYDIISLTTDARRDVSPDVQRMCINRFVAQLDLDPIQFSRDAAICSVQRNLRILAIFSRMSLHFKKPNYINLIPRVWAHIMKDLSHPDLSALAKVVTTSIPAPTPNILKRLKEQCGTISKL